jgi:pimeloyl-ACP methyl ester carboxylesterase
MLHEGLGSVSHWREFPDRVAAATGSEVFVYSRYGHGRSSPLEEPRGVFYMHVEAELVLAGLLEQSRIQRPVLLGHSDGASIAILYAARFPNSVAGLILEAPHVFVEERTVESIAQAKVAYGATDLPRKLARYHEDADRTFWGWNDIWLDPRFRSWNIESCLESITCPVLVIQGADDEYGTVKQIEAIQSRIPATEVALFTDCKHAPHRDQPELTLQRTIGFMNSVTGSA